MDARVILGAVHQAVVYRIFLIAGGVSGVFEDGEFRGSYMNLRRGMLAVLFGAGTWYEEVSWAHSVGIQAGQGARSG